MDFEYFLVIFLWLFVLMDTTQKSKIVDLRWTPFENSDAMSTSPKAVIASSSSVVAVWDKLS